MARRSKNPSRRNRLRLTLPRPLDLLPQLQWGWKDPYFSRLCQPNPHQQYRRWTCRWTTLCPRSEMEKRASSLRKTVLPHRCPYLPYLYCRLRLFLLRRRKHRQSRKPKQDLESRNWLKRYIQSKRKVSAQQAPSKIYCKGSRTCLRPTFCCTSGVYKREKSWERGAALHTCIVYSYRQ